MPIYKLTHRKIQTAKPKNNPYKIFDGRGLYVLIKPNGTKYWRMKYRIKGKEKLRSYGRFPEISLDEVRNLAEEDLVLIRQDVDPIKIDIENRNNEKFEAKNSFQFVASEWIEKRIFTWKSEKHKADVIRSIELDILPKLGGISINDITPVDVLECVRSIEERGVGETAYRALQRIRSIFRYSIATGRCLSNPARDLTPALKKIIVKHHPALSEQKIAEFLIKLENFQGSKFTKIALELIHLTALRPKELRFGRWEEINLEAENPEWRIPGERMKIKADKEHIVPLSKQAVVLLKDLRSLSGHGEILFTGRNNPARPISENTMNKAIAKMGYKGLHSSHGSRTVFSTISNESELWPVDAIELQLDHKLKDKIRAAYSRGLYLKQRRKLMQWYADYLDELKLKGGNRNA